MSGGLQATVAGRAAEAEVDALASRLGLVRVAKKPVSLRGLRAWGTKRLLDRIYTLPSDGREYWVEVKSQAGRGSAFERILALTAVDKPTWAHWGCVVVVKGGGIPEACYNYLLRHGAVDMVGLEADMRDFIRNTHHIRKALA